MSSAIKEAISMHKEVVKKVLSKDKHSWKSLVYRIEEADDIVSKAWAPIRHLNSVMNDKNTRSQYEKSLKMITSYYNKVSQNPKLYRAYESLYKAEKHTLDEAQVKLLENTLLDFKLSGVALSSQKRKSFREKQNMLSSLESKFEQNVLDSTNAWAKNITDVKALAGLPKINIEIASNLAKSRKEKGHTLGLDQPCYTAVLSYAEDRNLRKEVYLAYTTRASDKFPLKKHSFDNKKIIEKILSLRHEASSLLGFKNYAEYSLATKMVSKPEKVILFLEDLKSKALKKAKDEVQVLKKYAKNNLKIDDIKPWDFAYVSEKYKKENFGINEEELKPYFSVEQVLLGLFSLVKKLYGIEVKQCKTKEIWHPDVRLYEIYDRTKRLRGKFYLDLYARPTKRGGAWMDECIQRRVKKNGEIQHPIAFITCNSTPPTKKVPALFRHYDVETLFHEFGHGLHHMLTKIDYAGVSGISGVEWDAVELPSQFMENWCWEKEVLDKFAFHYETKEKLPNNLFSKLKKTKNYNSGIQTLRQVEFSLYDFLVHLDKNKNKTGLSEKVLREVRKTTSLIKHHKDNRFQNSFSHIYAGGYAAGYYSYKWAEVLSADAFLAFKKRQTIDYTVGREFMKKVLEKGGSKPAIDLFKDFRGREPKINALIKDLGLA